MSSSKNRRKTSQKDTVKKLTASLKKCRAKVANLTKKNKQSANNNSPKFAKTHSRHKKIMNLFMPNHENEFKTPAEGFKRTKARRGNKELVDNIPFNMSIHNTVKNKKHPRTKTRVQPNAQSNNLHLVYRRENNVNEARGAPENIPHNPNTNRVIQIQPRGR